MAYKVVHADAPPGAPLPIERAALRRVGVELVCAGAMTTDKILAAAHDADVLLLSYASADRALIDGLQRCLAICSYGIGVDHIDVQAASECGILIVNTPAFCVEEVANHAILLLLVCARKLKRFDQEVRAGRWPQADALDRFLPMPAVVGEHLGLVGFGNIGRAVAVRAQALGLKVSAYDPYTDAAAFARYGVEPAELDALAEASDYLSLHTPLTLETHHLIDAARLRRMKPTAFLINTGRGAVVDQAALIRALQEQWIAGAGLDVMEGEPPAPDNPLLAMDNVVLTPHIGSFTEAAYARMYQRAADEAARVVSGEWPTAIVNPEIKERSRLAARLAGR